MRNNVSRWIERRWRSGVAEISTDDCFYCSSSPDEKVGLSERYPASDRLPDAFPLIGLLPVWQVPFPRSFTRTSGSDRWLCVRASCDRGPKVESRGTPYLVQK